MCRKVNCQQLHLRSRQEREVYHYHVTQKYLLSTKGDVLQQALRRQQLAKPRISIIMNLLSDNKLLFTKYTQCASPEHFMYIISFNFNIMRQVLL